MRPSSTLRVVLAVTLACYVAPRAAAQASSIARDSAALAATGAVVRLHNGPNPVDVLGDRSRATVFVARRGNYNAHGHSTVAFYVRAAGESNTAEWQIIPFMPTDTSTSQEVVGTEEGADCILSDLRVLRPRGGGPVTVVIAHRELGRSYADPAPLRFELFRLRHNVDGVPGWPPYYFARERAVRPTRPYCDVNQAFAQELGLGRAGIGAADGGR